MHLLLTTVSHVTVQLFILRLEYRTTQKNSMRERHIQGKKICLRARKMMTRGTGVYLALRPESLSIWTQTARNIKYEKFTKS